MMATVQFVSYAFLLWNFYWIFCQCLSSENRCLGGPSLRGLVDMPKSRDEVSCCDDYGCYGYRVDFVERLVNNSFQLPAKGRLKRYSVQRKAKRFARRTRSTEVEKINDVTVVSTSCCSTNVSILFPISGISATRMERVTVLQTPSLRQPVVYQLCNEEPCKLLRGNCSQVYTPQIFYTVSLSNTSSPPVIVQDHVFVESGCTCTTSLQKNFSKISQSFPVDPAVAEVIQLLTRRPSTYTPKLSNDKPDTQNLPVPVPLPTPERLPSASVELLTNSPATSAPGSNNAISSLTDTQNLTSADPVPVLTAELHPSASAELLTNSPPTSTPELNNEIKQNLTSADPTPVPTPELPSSVSVELITSSPSTNLPGLNNDISSLTENKYLTSPVSAPKLLPSASIELATSSPSINTPEFKNNINSLTDELKTSPVSIPTLVSTPELLLSASVDLSTSSPLTSAPEFKDGVRSWTDTQNVTMPVSVRLPTSELLPSASSPPTDAPGFNNEISNLTGKQNLTSPVPISVPVSAHELLTSASVELLVSNPPPSAPEFNNEINSLIDKQNSPVSVPVPEATTSQPKMLFSARMLNLPLMSNLPPPGYPISIPEGLFHPVLLLMETSSIHQHTTHTT